MHFEPAAVQGVRSTIYVSSYYYMCVLILLYMCPHTAIYVSTYYYLCPRTARCGYISSQQLCKACVLLQDLARRKAELEQPPRGAIRYD
jgi:hypothetical protein